MASGEANQYASCGSYEWAIPNFLEKEERQTSPTFEFGGYVWQLICDPQRDKKHTALFLKYSDAEATPAHLGPHPTLKLIIKNHNDTKKPVCRAACSRQLNCKCLSWGFTEFMPLSDITSSSGYLRGDGALVVQVEVSLPQPGGTYPTKLAAPAAGLSADLLALLDNPGSTADITIIATPATPLPPPPLSSAAGAGDSGQQPERQQAAGAGASSWKHSSAESDSDVGGTAAQSSAPSSSPAGPTSRRFEVHRAILAARCPYFRTLFQSGLGDSGARELTLLDTDPDALAVLLRFMYGADLDVTCREQARSCLALADRLLLTQAVELLREHLVSTVSAATFVADLLCASGLEAGQEALLAGLLQRYAYLEEEVAEEELELVAVQQPALMVKLLASHRRAAKRARK